MQITAEILNMTARDMVVFVEDSAKVKGCNLTISIDTFAGLCDPDKLPAKGIKAKANAVANILKGYGGILPTIMFQIVTSPDVKLQEDMIALLDLTKDMSDDDKLTLQAVAPCGIKLTQQEW